MKAMADLLRQGRYADEVMQSYAVGENGLPAKVGRNAPCPCGSGRKYKRCHGADAKSRSEGLPAGDR